MNTTEENKLIAEFMVVNIHEYVMNGGKTLEYHTSWDWLMPVLKKINLLLTPQNYDEWRMIGKPTEYDIERVHNQAVEFIKWYKSKRN